MLTKLAVRNVKRSVKDYILYVITVTLIVALMFAFNSMMFSELILGMNSHLVEYRTLLMFFSVIVLVVVAWLINYMTKFMLEKRSREFGTYLILGMENRDVSKMFMYENFILGSVSLIIGMFIGEFVFQGLLAVVVSFFGADYTISHHLNLTAFLLTAADYAAVQLIAVFRNNRYLKKLKVHDLMNASKVNESVDVKHAARNTIIFIAGISAAVLSVLKTPIIVTIICIVVFIYGFYMGLSGILTLIISKTKRFRYKGMNLFIFRQLSSKINTMGFTMGTIAVLFTLALLSGNYAIGLGSIRDELETYTPFDISISSLDPEDNFSEAREMLSDNGWIKNELCYKIYRTDNDRITAVMSDNDITGGYFKYDTCIKLSDYNTLRGFLGLEPAELSDSEFALHCASSVSEIYDSYIAEAPALEIDGNSLSCRDIMSEDFSQNGHNGAGVIIVVPDRIADSLDIYYSQYVCQSAKETDDELYNELLKYVEQDAEHWATAAHSGEELDHGMGIESMYVIYDNIMIKNGGKTAEVHAALITVIISIFYIALVFICVALTILAIQQLSDSTKYKFRYRVLNSLGVDEKQRSGLIFRQLLIYFGCPVILPLAISLAVSMKINSLIMTGTQIQESNYSFFGGSVVVFLVVYAVYFTATYIGFKRNIEVSQ